MSWVWALLKASVMVWAALRWGKASGEGAKAILGPEGLCRLGGFLKFHKLLYCETA